MFGQGKKFKVFDSIVNLVAVFMVNNLRWEWKQFPSKMFFHYISMLKNCFFVYAEPSVSIFRYISKAWGIPCSFKRIPVFPPKPVVLIAPSFTIPKFIATCYSAFLGFIEHSSIVTIIYMFFMLFLPNDSFAARLSGGGGSGGITTISTTTAGATNFVFANATSLQTGATFYVSSGTSLNLNASSLTVTTYSLFQSVSSTTFQSVSTMTFGDGVLVDMSNINMSTDQEGLLLPQATSCANSTREGQVCWDSDDDVLNIGGSDPSQVIMERSILQSGATFYVSSGTALNLNVSSLTVVSTLTVSGKGVCLADGTNCTAETGDIQGVTAGYGLTGGGTTGTVTLNLDGGTSSYIQNRATLQSGATFYVSSGTALNLNVSSLTVVSTLTVTGKGVCLADGTNCSSTGGADNLGSHVATKTVTMNFGFSASTGVLTSTLTVTTMTVSGRILVPDKASGTPVIAKTSDVTDGIGFTSSDIDFIINGASLFSVNSTLIEADVPFSNVDSIVVSTQSISSTFGASVSSDNLYYVRQLMYHENTVNVQGMTHGIRHNLGEDPYYFMAPYDQPNGVSLSTPIFHMNVSTFSSSSGFLGLGISTPTAKLHVKNGSLIVDSGLVAISSITYGLAINTGSTNTVVGSLVVVSSNSGTNMFEANPLTGIVTSSSPLVMNGYLQYYSRTAAQIAAITPSVVGQAYYCSNCTAQTICISTGTSAGQFSGSSSRTAGCN